MLSYKGIPDTEYTVDIHMPAGKFQRICKDLGQIGDAITISCSKNDVRFAASGDLGSGNVRLNQTASADKPDESVSIKMQEPILPGICGQVLEPLCKGDSTGQSGAPADGSGRAARDRVRDRRL